MTLVVDAAVVVEVLLGTRRGGKAAALLGGHDLLAPQHLTAEVASVFRGLSLGGHITEEQALRGFEEFRQLGVEQLPMDDLLSEVWAQRHNMAAYDAMYVVLARVLGCQLLTLDVRLAKAASDCTITP